MSIEEQSLRDLLDSPHALSCVHSLFAAIQKGEEVRVELLDSSVLSLSTRPEVELALQLWFQWPEKKGK